MVAYPAYYHKIGDETFGFTYMYYFQFLFGNVGNDYEYFGGQGTNSWTDELFTGLIFYAGCFLIPFFGMNIVLAIFVTLWDTIDKKSDLVDLTELN
jgi:hypothetical protein